jgi:tRNA threonylcarbamoyl adenosine modification protein YeaZ
MNFLSIDCSTDLNSLFIKYQSKTYNKILQSDKSNYDLLMKNILDFFSKNNLKLDDINEIFVNQGPGSFSGLRSSLSVAKGISLSKNLNLYGYNTFIWSCSKFFNKKNFIYSIIKLREKYYIKKFNKNLLGVSKVEIISKEEILNNYENRFKVVPKNMIKYFDEKILNLNDLKIVDLDHKELEFLKLKDLLDKDLIKPLYLS